MSDSFLMVIARFLPCQISQRLCLLFCSN